MKETSEEKAVPPPSVKESGTESEQEILGVIARRAVVARGFWPDFSPGIRTELNVLGSRSEAESAPVLNFTGFTWISIDRGDSHDLDQLTSVEDLSDGAVRIRIAVSDVDHLVAKDSLIDGHARHNGASVYTLGGVFPMLPEELSSGLSSLLPGQDCRAFVIEAIIADDGSLHRPAIYPALVRNHAKLSYGAVSGWLNERRPLPEGVGKDEQLLKTLLLHDRTAERMKAFQEECGGVEMEAFESCPAFHEEDLQDLFVNRADRARWVVEEFMIAANRVIGEYLIARRVPLIRRVIRSPRRWDRVREIVSDFGFQLPAAPDARPLHRFLAGRRFADPDHYPHLSVAISKLIGPGEYVVETAEKLGTRHFGLALRDTSHATAPNRRFSDLVNQRILKAALLGRPSPYPKEELEKLAVHCTSREHEATKVERLVGKSAVALALGSRIGHRFDAIVTGASSKGAWVRIHRPPVEGKLVNGDDRIDVGLRLKVELVSSDPERGHIDFRRVD
jgi:VacB/RNase II family 3'-5' exoribonuclease